MGATAAGGLVSMGQRLGGVGVVNLEGPVQADADADSAWPLVNAPQVARALKQAGVAVAGVANNHAQDLGPMGVEMTMQTLERAGIQPSAFPRNAHLMLAGLPVVVSAHDLSAGLAPDLEQQLAGVAVRGEIWVATFHVQGPHSYLPPPLLEAAVDAALAHGATVVAAHGTHELARVERRGRSVVAYGLGNLVFVCPCGHGDDGLVLRVQLDHNGAQQAQIIPVEPGRRNRPVRLAQRPDLTLDLLVSLRSTPLRRAGAFAWF